MLLLEDVAERNTRLQLAVETVAVPITLLSRYNNVVNWFDTTGAILENSFGPLAVRMWRNWQTRMIQVHVFERTWRFKSSHPHQQFSGRHSVSGCREKTMRAYSSRIPSGYGPSQYPRHLEKQKSVAYVLSKLIVSRSPRPGPLR
jgi:hypothetical protein